MKIFIVRGSTGEYSDRSDWTVAACFSRESADKLEAECTGFLIQHYLHTSNVDDTPEDDGRWRDERTEDAKKDPACPDPNLKADYTGSDYFVEALDVRVLGGRAEIEAFADALMSAREEAA